MSSPLLVVDTKRFVSCCKTIMDDTTESRSCISGTLAPSALYNDINDGTTSHWTLDQDRHGNYFSLSQSRINVNIDSSSHLSLGNKSIDDICRQQAQQCALDQKTERLISDPSSSDQSLLSHERKRKNNYFVVLSLSKSDGNGKEDGNGDTIWHGPSANKYFSRTRK